MRNIKLVVAFDGTAYAGWQRQKESPTIQGVLEEKISLMTLEQVVVNGAGRTDAGVHALGMTANFNTASSIPASGFYKGLNSLLPGDIRVLSALEVDRDFHARKSAVGKTYLYNLIVDEVVLPTERLYSTLVVGPFDPEPVRQCLDILVGEHDFASFEATGSRDPAAQGRGSVRRIFKAELSGRHGSTKRLVLSISGDGFLRHMVRNIAGTLIEVGSGKITVESFKEILAARDRTLAGPTAPARGLFLKEVFY